MQANWSRVVSDFPDACLIGTGKARQQPERKASQQAVRATLPKFSLVSATIFKGEARKYVRGQDPSPAPCRGFASEACATNRMLKIECEQGACNNRRLQRRAFRLLQVRPFWRNGKMHWGAFMEEDGKEGDIVEEYVGEGLTYDDFEQRLDELGLEDDWFFCSLAHGVVLDATHVGSYARFINHHCQPNAELRPWSVKTYRRLAVTLKHDLGKGKEVTFSYDCEHGDLEQDCWCGASNCTGKIHRLPRGARRAKTGWDGALPADDGPKGSRDESPPPGEAAGSGSKPCVSPSSPPTKRVRRQSPLAVVTGEIVAEDDAGGRSSEAAVTGVVVKQESPAVPSDREVLEAMSALVSQMKGTGSDNRGEGWKAWQDIGQKLSQLPDDAVRAGLLASSYADNIRAFLSQKGAPFVLPADISFDSPLSARVAAAPSTEVIDLTDSPPPSPRLDAGDAQGGVPKEGGRSGRDAEAVEGGQSVGGI